MSNLIDREDAIEEIVRRDTTDGNVKVYGGREIIDILKSLPIIKLGQREGKRKTGRWEMEWLPNTNGGHYQVFRCTECHNAFNWQMNFCGHCGADMRGEINEHTNQRS